MNFILRAREGDNKWWQYVVGIIAVIVCFAVLQMLLIFVPLIFNQDMARVFFSGGVTDEKDMAELYGTNLFLFLMLASFIGGLAGLWIALTKLHKRSFMTVITGNSRFLWGRFFFAFGCWLLLLVSTDLVFYFVTPESYSFQFDIGSFLTLLFIVCLLVPFQAGLEEVFTRGYLFQGIGLATRTRWVPLLVTSILFGILHIWNPEVEAYGVMQALPIYIIFGLLLGITVLIDNGLESALGLHIVNNIYAGAFVNYSNSALPTKTPVTNESMEALPHFYFTLAFIIISTVFLLILIKRYGPGDLPNLFKRIQISVDGPKDEFLGEHLVIERNN